MRVSPSGITITPEIERIFRDYAQAFNYYELTRNTPAGAGELFKLCEQLNYPVNYSCDDCKAGCIKFLNDFKKENNL